ncbi:MAG: hypothetical protein JCHSAcid_06730 [uncultured Acidilobus sp. JCHS]|jgi:hypothetical protein|nr:MAG: hypothetical protein JCHSAcid_06730 [uncultured Acidilobus sp. JCHS]
MIQMETSYLERLDLKKNIILLYITYKMMQVCILGLLIYLFQLVPGVVLVLCI